MTADIRVINLVLSGLPSGNLSEPSGMRLFSYLLTGLLTDLLTEANFTAYGPAYGGCLQRWLGTTSNSLNLTQASPRQKLSSFIKRSVKCKENGMFLRRWPTS